MPPDHEVPSPDGQARTRSERDISKIILIDEAWGLPAHSDVSEFLSPALLRRLNHPQTPHVEVQRAA